MANIPPLFTANGEVINPGSLVTPATTPLATTPQAPVASTPTATPQQTQPVTPTTPTTQPPATPPAPVTPTTPAPTTPAPAAPVAPTTPAPTPNIYTGPSIVDYLNHTNQASDFTSRSKLAEQYGIKNYTGSASQNTQLLNTLRTANPPTPQPTATTPTGTVGESGTLGKSTTETQNTGTPDPYAGLDPVAKQVKMYTDAYKSLGLSTIKDQFDTYTKQLGDIQNELSDKKMANQNNPWLSQGLVDKMNENLDTKYATKIDTFTKLLSLTDSMYKQGQAQVDHLVSDANADIKATNDLAQKQIDAATALAKDNVVQSVGGRELLINKETGKTVADLGPVTPSSSANSLADKEALALFNANLKQSSGSGDYTDTKAQNALEQQYRTALEKELSNRSGGLGLQDAKVNQAIHLKALFNQYKDANGNYNIPQAQYVEVAMGLANLVAPTGQVSDSARESILQRTANGDFKGALTYITGSPQTGSTQAVFKNLIDSIDRQGQVSQELRDQYIGFLHGLAPTGLDPARISKLESKGLASYSSNSSPHTPGGVYDSTTAGAAYGY